MARKSCAVSQTDDDEGVVYVDAEGDGPDRKKRKLQALEGEYEMSVIVQDAKIGMIWKREGAARRGTSRYGTET